MIVLKFGGTSVGDADAIGRAATITRSKLDRRPVVVVSALAGVTTGLLALAEHAADGQLVLALRGVEAIRDRHLHEADALLTAASDGDETRAELSAMCDELASLGEALSVLGHATPRSLDAIVAYGELLSTTLVHAAFVARGLPCDLIDARDLMCTDDSYTRAVPRLEDLTRETRDRLLPLLATGRVPLLGGFIGRSSQGVTTTIGRGGGDYSAALIGAALDAAGIEIWTDVDGMLTADPRLVATARLIEEIRFDEAAELASFGAKVLHPSTIAPAVQRGIPVFIYNARHPGAAGTRITADAPRRAVCAIAGKGDVAVVKVRSSRMLLAHGFLHRFFEVFERRRVSVDVVSTSEVSVSVTVDEPRHLDALVIDLRALGDVTIERHRAVIAIVGAGLGGRSEIMARALGAVHGIRLHMLSVSATGINLTMIVDADALAPAMRALHGEFFEHAEDAP
ncbi:MAG TPA: aspartate kinase [Gemmatimonadaceae bacterium]|nr:aspartate kinase [Gemmatimonadaceae bacterium]